MSFEMKYDRDGLPVPGPAPVVEEVADQMVEQPVLEVEQAQKEQVEPNDVVEEPPVTPVAKPSAKESWKTIRDRMAAAEKRAQDLEQALKQAQSKPDDQSPDEDLSINIEEDALAEGKHLKKVDKRFNKMQKELEQYKQELKQAQQQTQQQTIRQNLKTQFPDFEQVCNDENIARLQVQEPELYKMLDSSSDLYATGVSAYKMIKQMGIASPQDFYSAERALAHKNSLKPKPLASISPQQGDSPLSKANAFANGLTDDVKKSLWKEMEDIRKNF